MSKTQYRQYVRDNNRRPRGLVVCEQTGTDLVIGWSRQNKLDIFKKVEANSLAYERLHNHPIKISLTDNPIIVAEKIDHIPVDIKYLIANMISQIYRRSIVRNISKFKHGVLS